MPYDGNESGLCGAVISLKTTKDLNKKLSTWANNIDLSEKGRKEFYVGCGIQPWTLAHYLSHFYDINTNWTQASKLCGKKIVCAEVVFNLGSTAKAFRIKVVDSAGEWNGQKGTGNIASKNTYYYYDVLDIQIALACHSIMSEFVTINCKESKTGKKFGQLNNGPIKFPWYNSNYDYKKAKIYGYGPSAEQLKDLDMEEQVICKFVPSCSWKIHGYAPNTWPLARVRFFVDKENADIARQIYSDLPDEFFQTNFSDGGNAVWIGANSMDASTPVNARIVAAANKILGWITTYKQGDFDYVGDEPDKPYTFIVQNREGVSSQAANSMTPVYTPSPNRIDCDGFVNWVLLEAQLTTNTTFYKNISAAEWDAGKVNSILSEGYSAVTVVEAKNDSIDISKITSGDILIFGRGTYASGNPVHHAAICSRRGVDIQEYGAGMQSRLSPERYHNTDDQGNKTYDTKGMNVVSHLTRAIRIVKKQA